MEIEVRDENAAKTSKILELAANIARMKEEQKYLFFDPNPKQAQACNSNKPVVSVMGSNRCLGGESEVFDPVYGKLRRVDSIGEPFHVLAFDGQGLVTAKAEAPFTKAEDDIYHFTLSDGEWFTASRDHLVLTTQGWAPAGDSFCPSCLEPLPGFELYHPLSSLESVQSVRAGDDRHLIGTAQGSQSGCHRESHSCGEPLHGIQASGQDVQPLQADALAHNKAFDQLRNGEPLGVQGDGLGYNRLCQRCAHQSTQDGLPHHGGRAAGTQSRASGTVLKSAGDQHQGDHRSLHGLEDQPLSIGGSGPTATHSISCLSSEELLNAPSITSFLKVIEVQWLRKDVRWDFTVPVYANYLCAGAIHHNSGKTTVHAVYLTCHATGVYPSWWEGPRFNRPVDAAVIGKTNRAVRDVMQTALLGPVHTLGTGLIPRECLAKNPSKQQGVPDMVDTIFVKHISGGISTIKLFSCQMDVGVIMGQDWDIAGFDEEPDKAWSDQARMRVVSRRGRMFYTFTPEDGYTEVVNELLEMPEESCERITITVDDAEKYYPQDVRERLERDMPEWQKEFRLYGRPSVGEKGRVFKFSRDMFVIEPMDPEPHWRRVAGLDVGYGHPTVAIDIYIDDSTPEATFYVLNEYFSKEELPDIHAAKLRTWGDVDFYVDPSSRRRAPTDGQDLYSMYEARGLSIQMANNDLEASITLINQLLANRQLFISSDCEHLIDQMGLYRRVIDKKSYRAVILRRDNDCIDGLRYGLMAHESSRIPMKKKPKPWEVVQKVNIKQWKPLNPRIGY